MGITIPEKQDFSDRLKKLKASPSIGKMLVICHHCAYPWESDSNLEMVSCPSCGGKTPRKPENKSKPMVK